MNWFERKAASIALERMKAKLGGDGMNKLASIGLWLGGVVAIVTGVQSGISHFMTGDLFAKMCDANGANCVPTFMHIIAEIGAGAAVFSPGLQSLKVGFFARPHVEVVTPEGEVVAVEAKVTPPAAPET